MSPDQQAWAEHLALISRLDPKELLSCFPDLPQERNHFWVTVYAACIILTDSLPKATNISEVTDWHIVRGKAQTILHRHKVRLRRHQTVPLQRKIVPNPQLPARSQNCVPR